MAVWIVGIPMVDRDPVELRAKIHLHPCHEIAGEAAKVFDVLRVLGGDDETELVAIALDAPNERLAVGRVAGAVVGHAGLMVAGDALAFDVANVTVGRPRCRPGPMGIPGLSHAPPDMWIRRRSDDGRDGTGVDR